MSSIELTTSLDPLELEFIANDVIETYMNPSFKLDEVNFQLLSTVRYDPLLDAHFPETISKGDIPSTTAYEIDETSELITLGNSNTIPSSQFFLFDEHVHRIKLSLLFFKWHFQITESILLTKLNEALKYVDNNLPYKCRVLISKTGELTIEVVSVPINTNLMEGFFIDTPLQNVWSVYIDRAPIQISPFTSFKTTKRDHYTESRLRTLPQDTTLKEVLVYNEADQVMEGSITNIAFKRTKLYPSTGKMIERWVTPPLSSGCLCGVVRHMLISKNLIEEEPIKLSEISAGEDVLLFNGIIGVVKGVIL